MLIMNSTPSSISDSLPDSAAGCSIDGMKTATHSALGARISTRLKELGKNQVWLAEKMDLSNEAISKWINGKTDPKLSNLRKVAGLLKCSVGYLAGDDEDGRIAEVARIMWNVEPDSRASILAGVVAVAATLPSVSERKRAS